MALLKLCRCGRKISIELHRCDTCEDNQKDRHKSYDKSKRDKVSSSFYHSKEWSLVRQQALSRDKGLCLHCLKRKQIKTADMVDHIIPVKVDWHLRLTLTNLQSLCNGCHNKKTAEDKRVYKG